MGTAGVGCLQSAHVVEQRTKTRAIERRAPHPGSRRMRAQYGGTKNEGTTHCAQVFLTRARARLSGCAGRDVLRGRRFVRPHDNRIHPSKCNDMIAVRFPPIAAPVDEESRQRVHAAPNNRTALKQSPERTWADSTCR